MDLGQACGVEEHLVGVRVRARVRARAGARGWG